MATEANEDRGLITELSKQIVEQIAPEETDLFDELMASYFADPSPPDLTADPRDDPLGFGLNELMIAVTPAAAAVASAAIAFVMSVLAKAARDEGAEQIRRRLKSALQSKRNVEGNSLTLTPSQLETLLTITRETAGRYGMDPEQSDAMANAVLVALLLGNDASDGDAPKTLKILFLAANPLGTQQIRLDQEIRSIDTVLRASHRRGRIRLEQQWAVRVSDLQALLLRHRPDIVHFSGHGSPASALILEDAAGRPREVPNAALADLFRLLGDTVRCVVLNACYSRAQAATIVQHVDAVIGMDGAMGDQASIAFSAAFYQALGYGEDVPSAFWLGVSQIKLDGLDDAAIPQLVTR